jgi:hypothetical protein
VVCIHTVRRFTRDLHRIASHRWEIAAPSAAFVNVIRANAPEDHPTCAAELSEVMPLTRE